VTVRGMLGNLARTPQACFPRRCWKRLAVV